MGKCSEEVLNSIREELKSLGVTDTEVINKIVSTFESTVETDEKAEEKRLKSKELGQSIIKIASECIKKSNSINSLFDCANGIFKN